MHSPEFLRRRQLEVPLAVKSSRSGPRRRPAESLSAIREIPLRGDVLLAGRGRLDRDDEGVGVVGRIAAIVALEGFDLHEGGRTGSERYGFVLVGVQRVVANGDTVF